MRRKTLQLLAVAVLMILGAPLAMHVVLHDLHGHHDEDRHQVLALSGDEHDTHEHPVVASPSSQLPPLTQVELPIEAAPSATTPPSPQTERDSLSFRALRLDDDVGLQALFSTFLI